MFTSTISHILCFLFVIAVNGHGRLDLPQNRGSMWRLDPSLPPNYDDNANFCGGYGAQHGPNNHKCGLCGDNYADKTPRNNEDGGEYGQGMISETYIQGQEIDARVDLSANHLGDIQYSLCNLDEYEEESEECFDKHRVLLANGTSKWLVHADQINFINMTLKLPDSVFCERCVLRWQYTTGNFAGICEDGTEAVGCGYQENFKTCSDIKIRRK